MHISELSTGIQESGDHKRGFYNQVHLHFGSKPELEAEEERYDYIVGCLGFNTDVVIPYNFISAAAIVGRK